jgi:hypothetical protein
MRTKVVSQQQHAARPTKAGTPLTSGMKAVGTRGTSWMSTAAGPPESVGKSVTVENLATGMPEQQGPNNNTVAPIGTPTEGADMLGTKWTPTPYKFFAEIHK